MNFFPIFLIFFSLALTCFSQSNNYNLKKVDWILSNKDFDLVVSDEKVDSLSHKLEISRKTSVEAERLLIRKAEAIYPKEISERNKGRNPQFKGKGFSPSIEEEPFWSDSGFDGVKIAWIISTRAIDYYQKLSFAYRNDKKPTNIEMSQTGLNYSANVVHYDKYEFKKEIFENVNIVFMKLDWSQYCGGDCAMGFTREKIVIFDINNEPVALFIDEKSGAWVS